MQQTRILVMHQLDVVDEAHQLGAELGVEIVALVADDGRTKVMRFVDDVEFVFDEKAGLIHVRSASRLGRRDFGVNRARVEAVRRRVEGTTRV